MIKRIHFSLGDESLAREGLNAQPEAWEDGLRAKPQAGNFEWWYFDALFEDGSSAAITFFTKPILDRNSILNPGVNITLMRPDGQVLNNMILTLPEEFSASKERCYVRAGESFVRGDLHQYELHARASELSVMLNFTALVPAWRPGDTGKFFFDEAQTRYFAWLPVMPHSTVEGLITYKGKMRTVKGTGYHEHIWGNTALKEAVDHYYRGHAHLGDYTLIFSEMTGTQRFGGEKIRSFMLARDSKILLSTSECLDLDEKDFLPDEGGRSYPDGLDFKWEKDTEFVRLKLSSPHVIDAASLLDLLPVRQNS